MPWIGAALERGRAGGVYKVVDDTPATFADLITTIAAERRTPAPLVAYSMGRILSFAGGFERQGYSTELE